nr:immunoglobulin heavy chain junction region [Macaca mulatta]MOY22989.1 immunoglobulin heavy chain junction region [Macaca mulatta]MOY23927.1 immunoglobulin heavy chain junction region [Macaca mulatta]MOY24723.1 immunoglobulin heavy chain junction region [Macaca mulatta]MOY26683.1 immunoglobulin heavy chain junction region [Macaca mulatta]
CTTSMDVW